MGNDHGIERFRGCGREIDPEPFQILARRFLGPEVTAVRHVGSVAEQFPTGSLSQVSSQMLAEHAALGERGAAGPSTVRASDDEGPVS